MSIRPLRLVLAVLALFALTAPLLGDLDVSTPPGTAEEWSRGLPTPVTTGRGSPPVRTGPAPNPGGDRPIDPDQTVVARPPAGNLDIPVLNAYGYFRITTPDMPQEVVLTFPQYTQGPDQQSGRVVTGPRSSLQFNYPPLFPPELVWDAMVVCLRMQLHPEVTSDAGAKAHLIWLGEPALAGVQLAGTPDIVDFVKRQVGTVNAARPTPPGGRREPYTRMLNNLATVELVANWPAALDPNYCRRILSLGDDALGPLIRCSDDTHRVLRRNATWALAGFEHEDALKQLRKLAKDRDMVVRVRALKALARKRDTDSAEIFRACATSNDDVLQTLGWYGLGMLSDRRALPLLRRDLKRAMDSDNRDLLLAILPALIRIGAPEGDRNTLRLLKGALRKFRSAFPAANAQDSYGNRRFPRSGAVSPEQKGFRNMVFWQMALLAAAVCGDADSRDELSTMMLTDFHQVNWYLYCEANATIGEAAEIGRLRDVLDGPPESSVGVHALVQFVRVGATTADLEQLARTHADYMVRARALLELARRNAAGARVVCRDMLADIDIDQEDDAAAQNPQKIRDMRRLREIQLELRTVNPNSDRTRWLALQREMAQLRGRLMMTPRDTARERRGARAWFLSNVLTIGGRLGAFRYEQLVNVVRTGYIEQLSAKREGSLNLQEIPRVNIFPALFETAVVELGRTEDPRAVPLLLEILDARMAAGSPEAAIALAKFRSRGVAFALTDALVDPEDGWLRFCAWRALKAMSDKDHMRPWFAGHARDFASAASKYRDWINREW